jgi:hypothetical protein
MPGHNLFLFIAADLSKKTRGKSAATTLVFQSLQPMWYYLALFVFDLILKKRKKLKSIAGELFINYVK